MKAILFDHYGPPDVLHVEEVAKPVPRDRDVLVRVHATPVSFGDLLVRNFAAVTPRDFHMPFLFWLIGRTSFGFGRPRQRILGSEFAGEVEAVGRNVTRFAVGDRVFGFSGPRMGAYAQYLCMREDAVMARMPAQLTYGEAAALPYGAIMALGILRKAALQPGQRVLVNGASGGIGPSLVQLAVTQFGARVTGVCGTARLDYVRALGAANVIDYTKEDFVENGEVYDLIIDIPGKLSLRRCERSLTPHGRLLFVSFKMRQVVEMLWTSVSGEKKVTCVLVDEKQEDLVLVGRLVEEGKLRAVVDETFPLERASDAHRYAESGAKKGAVVLTVC